MSISRAKSHAHRAKYSSQSDTDRIKYLADAVYELVKVVSDLETEISNLESKVRRLA